MSSSEISSAPASTIEMRVGGAAQLQVQIGVLALLVGGVDDKLAWSHVTADAHAGKRALEGHAAKRHGQGSTHDVDDVEGLTWSATSEVATMCTSLRKPSGKLGRIGRSIVGP